RQLLIALGIAPRGGNYETVKAQIRTLGLDAAHSQRSRRTNLKTNDEIATAVRTSRSYAGVLSKLGINAKRRGTSLKRRIDQLSLHTSHFTGQAWRRGSTIPVTARRPLEEVLVTGKLIRTHELRRRLIEQGVKKERFVRSVGVTVGMASRSR